MNYEQFNIQAENFVLDDQKIQFEAKNDNM